MRQLWLFLSKYHILFLFIFLELIGFGLLFTKSNYQKAKFIKSTGFFQSRVTESRNNITNYFNLKEKNQVLATENAQLQQKLKASTTDTISLTPYTSDSLTQSIFSFNTAQVITNQLNNNYNHITINKGKKDNIEAGDGVATDGGVVGKVVSTSNNYALIMSLFNRNMRLNIQHQKSTYNGDLTWQGNSLKTVQALNISRNALVEIGDTIVTNQFSKTLPINTPVGIVTKKSFGVDGNFYELEIEPLADFRKLNYVYIIKRKDMEEITTLETTNE